MSKILPVFAALLVVPFAADVLRAADAVPSEYVDLYADLERSILAFESEVDAEWDGSRAQTAFAAGVGSANGHRGLALLQEGALDGVRLELDGLRNIGVRTAVVTIPYPVLHQPFHQTAEEYAAILGFYRSVAQAVRERGMGLVVETPVLFTEGGFSAWPQERLNGLFNVNQDPGFDLTGYFAGRAAAAKTIAQEMAPDYLSVMNEPDTSANMTGIPQLNDVAVARLLLDAILSELQGEREQGLKVGAGIGPWHPQFREFASSFLQAPMDYFDLHIFYANFDYLDRVFELTDMATASGMRVGVSQAWPMKSRDSELSSPQVFTLNRLFSRDAYSFWMPLDCRFASAMVKFSHLKNLEYLSPFWSGYFRAYLPYSDELNELPPWQLSALSDQAAADAHLTGAYTDAGRCYETAVLGRPDTTPPAPVAAPTANALGIDQIHLEWPETSDNVGVAGYNIYRDGEKIDTMTRTAHLDVDLEEATAYVYRVEAFDAFGNRSIQSPQAAQSTLDATAPSDPAGLTGQPLSQSSISLSWTASTDNVEVTQYIVYRGRTPASMYMWASATEPSYVDSGLPKGVTFYYAVRAVDAAFNLSAMSALVSVAPQTDTTPPSIPAGLAVQALSMSELRLTWAPSTDASGIAGYRVFVGASPDQLVLAAFVTGNSYGRSNLTPGRTLYFAVEAADSSYNYSARSAVAAGTTLLDLQPPSAPTALIKTVVSSSQINLSWKASTDNHGVRGYRIYCSWDGVNFYLVTFTANTSWTHAGLPAGYTFRYRVEALDLSGNVSTSVATR